MNKEPSHYGTLVRAFATGSGLVLVVETAEDSSFWTFSLTVTELHISGPGIRRLEISILEEKLGDPIWLTVVDGSVFLEGDFIEPHDLGPCHIKTCDREYDIADLRQKFLTLSRAFKSAEESDGALISRYHRRQEALEKFLTSQQHNVALKADFFAKTDPTKAKEMVAKMEVLAEIARIMKD
jgi:hypothetical protein